MKSLNLKEKKYFSMYKDVRTTLKRNLPNETYLKYPSANKDCLPFFDDFRSYSDGASQQFLNSIKKG